jgi:hypothetical protein
MQKRPYRLNRRTTMSTENSSMRTVELSEIIEEVRGLSEEYGGEVASAVRLAAEHPLDSDRAMRFWTRVLTILRSGGDELSDIDQTRLAREIRSEVERLVGSVPRDGWRSLEERELPLVERHGLTPHLVTPVPTFNGQPVPMWEGYVDVNELALWRDNHRIELHVQEFRERNQGREPTEEELLQLVQGRLHLPSRPERDPFSIAPLALSIARKGVERPPVLTWSGEPKDGNRRIAAAKWVIDHPNDFTPEERERARWVKVWRAERGTTPDQFEAVVVALNFESEWKIEWPEFIKARLVADRWAMLRESYGGRFTEIDNKALKGDVAKHFAITASEVTRYLRMVRWAEDFEQYHVGERERNPAEVRYKANEVFQWFYEIQAGRGNDKLTTRLDEDDELKMVVYDLMFDVLDSGALVRKLHKVVADDQAVRLLIKAHELADGDDDGKSQALEIVKEAVTEVERKNIARRKLGFDQWLRGAVEKLGATAPDEWRNIETGVLIDLRRVLQGTLGAVEGELATRNSTAAPEG